MVLILSAFQICHYVLKLSNNLNKKIGINMKIIQNKAPQVSFNGIICPNKYFNYLSSCTKEVTHHCNEIIVVPPKTNLLENNKGVVQFLKKVFKKKQPPVQIVSQKNPYQNGAAEFLEDPLQRMSKDGSYDYNFAHYSIYKFDEELGRSIPAKEEERKVFDMLKKKISELYNLGNNNSLSDELLLKKHGTAFVDDNTNTYQVKKTILDNIDTII